MDKLSSAHIYLRLREGETWDNIPEPLLTDLAQLTKANSIEGTSASFLIYLYFLVSSHEALYLLVHALLTSPPKTMFRQQERQHHHHLHAMVQSEERRQHGRWPGLLSRRKEGRYQNRNSKKTRTGRHKVTQLIRGLRSRKCWSVRERTPSSTDSTRPRSRNTPTLSRRRMTD